MGLQLVVLAGPDKGRTFPLTPDDWVLLGRSRATETRLNDPHVSKVHCKVEWTGGKVIVTDQDSTGGTFVNGRRVTQELLQSGGVIRIGETQLLLQVDDVAVAEAAEGRTVQLPAGVLAQAAAGRAEASGELTGKTLSHYLLGPVLARGTTGVIYRARDTQNNRDAAVKVLAPEFVRDDEAVQRFVRAMRTMLPLRHANLVAVYGAGKTGPHCWSAMEYVEGESLAQVIQRTGPAGKLDWRQGLRFAVHVARALGHAHRNAIIHRNLTPNNVIVRTSDQVAKLGDLMLAKALEGILAEKITRPGEVLGEVHYMSPERAASATNEDARSDLFSLGALTYALLTGRPPFEGASAVDTLLLIREAEPVKPTQHQPAVPAAFEEAVLKLLQKRPEDRHQTTGEALQVLEGMASSHAVSL
jgi:serine/threonine protein kinase